MTGRHTIALAAAASLWLTACCCPCADGCDPGCGSCDSSSCGPDIDLSPPPSGPITDLGLATYPPNHAGANAAVYDWMAQKLNPPRYKVGYLLSPTEANAVRTAHLQYARSVGYTPIDDSSFMWTPPRGCEGDMRCVFEAMVARNYADVKPLAARFRERARAANLDAMQAATLAITFVQKIRYEIPKSEPFGVLSPALVVAEKRGDCDSKALLGHMLMWELGIDSVLISSQAHKHSMLGVALPAGGTTFTHNGRRYAFVECTAEGSPIGHINRDLLSPNDWRPVPVRIRAAR